MSDQRTYSVELSMPSEHVDRVMQALCLIDDRQKAPGLKLLSINQRNAPFSEVFPTVPDDTPADLVRFTFALFQHLCDCANSDDDIAVETLAWEALQTSAELSRSVTRLALYSETDGWASLEPVTAVVSACQNELGADAAAIAFHQVLHGERESGAIVLLPGEKTEYFSLNRWIKERLGSPHALHVSPGSALDAAP